MAYTQQPPYDHGEGSPTVTGETDPLPPPFPPPFPVPVPVAPVCTAMALRAGTVALKEPPDTVNLQTPSEVSAGAQRGRVRQALTRNRCSCCPTAGR